MSNVEIRLNSLGIILPQVSPEHQYLEFAITTGKLVYTSGHDCRINGKLIYEGKLGRDLNIEQGKIAARQTMINLLAAIKYEIGNLDRIEKIIKLLVLVNCVPEFVQQPDVADGASALLKEVFGQSGKHARSAVGMCSLPNNTPVEIEMIVKLK